MVEPVKLYKFIYADEDELYATAIPTEYSVKSGASWLFVPPIVWLHWYTPVSEYDATNASLSPTFVIVPLISVPALS